jgi:hypothetical protein
MGRLPFLAEKYPGGTASILAKPGLPDITMLK